MAVRDWNNDSKIDSYDDWAEWEGLYGSDGRGGLNNVHDDNFYVRHRKNTKTSYSGLVFAIVVLVLVAICPPIGLLVLYFKWLFG